MAGNQQSVCVFEATSGIGRCDFTHGHAYNTCRTHAKVRQQISQGNLDSRDRYLGSFGVVGLRVVIDKL